MLNLTFPKIIGVVAEGGSNTFISKAIKFFSRGTVSHVEFLLENGQTIGSREFRGVQIGDVKEFKNPQTYIFWNFIENKPLALSQYQIDKLEFFFHSTLGNEYDYRGIVGFLFNKHEINDIEKHFCSEYVFEALEFAGIKPLNREGGHFVTPQNIVESLLFKKVD